MLHGPANVVSYLYLVGEFGNSPDTSNGKSQFNEIVFKKTISIFINKIVNIQTILIKVVQILSVSETVFTYFLGF